MYVILMKHYIGTYKMNEKTNNQSYLESILRSSIEHELSPFYYYWLIPSIKQ